MIQDYLKIRWIYKFLSIGWAKTRKSMARLEIFLLENSRDCP